MSNVPTNLIPTRITGLPEYLGSSTLGYMPYIIDGRTYKVQFANIAAVGAVPSTREINTGSGLGGGGDLSANRTLFILPGGVDDSRLSVTGVVAGTYGAADSIPVFTVNAQGRVTGVTDTPIVLSNYVPTSRTITAGAGLTGGGDLSANRSFAVNFSSTTPEPLGPGSSGVSTVAARGDHVHPAVDLSDTTETQGVLPLSRGGTGNSLSPVAGAIVYSSNDKLYLTTAGSVGQVLRSGGPGGVPFWTNVGAGTVTSVAVATANGFAGTVADPTLSPVITLSTTVTGLIKGNGTAISAAVAGTDYVEPGAYTASGLTMATARLLGRTTASVGAAQEISVGTGLTLSSGSLVNAAPDQTVSLTAGTAISVTGTYPSFTVTNTAPDQVVSLTGAGTTTVTGTYPSFTITSNDSTAGTVTSVNASGGTTGMSFTGGPITSAGTLTLNGTLAVANGGTGATDAVAALTNLGAYPASNPAGYTSNVGTVTSVSGTGTVSGLSLSGTVTSAGSLTLGGTLAVTPSDFASQTANTVLAAPNGSAGVPTFRAIVAADVPTLNQNTTGTAGNVSGIVAVANGGTGASVAATARTNLGAAASGANTDITSIALTTGTISTSPTSGTDIVNKDYADSIASGINFHQSVRLATTAALSAYTYNNGTSGVGATITANANGALSVDGVAAVAGNRILVKNESGAAEAYNGIYTVTQVGNGSTPYILTRATDFDSSGSGVDQIDAGDFFLVTAGSTLANTSWVQQTPLPITVGTTAIVFTQFGAPITYSAGTGLSLTGTTFSITNTGVSASTYGSASSVPVIAVNAQGQITSASASSIAIAASQITSGALAIANGGTGATDASGALSNLGAYPASNPSGFTSNTGTVTSVNLTAGTGVSVSGGPITASGSITVTNTAPDQVVSLTGSGATTVTGTYPNFTISSPTAGAGTVTSIDVSGGTTGLTTSGGPVTSSGTITLAGTLNVANGGTGATTLSSGYLLKGNGTSAVSASVVYDNGTNVGIGTTSPLARFVVANGSNENIEFTAGSVSINGGVLQYINRATSTTRPDMNYYLSSGGGAHKFYTNDTERMRIDDAGNVGIGTSTPTLYPFGAKLNVAGSISMSLGERLGWGITDAFTLNGVTTAQYGFTYGGGSNLVTTSGYYGLNFATLGSERMRLDTSGNLSIGTNTAANRLTVSATGLDITGGIAINGTSMQGIRLQNTLNDNSSLGLWFGTNNVHWAGISGQRTNFAGDWTTDLRFYTHEAALVDITYARERMRIDGAGNVGVGTASPAGRFHALGPAGADVLYRLEPAYTYASKLLISSVSSGDGGIRYGTSNDLNVLTYSTMTFNTGAISGSLGTERLTINISGNVTANVDIRSPIFYDSGNTAFYADMASTSEFNTIQTRGGSGFRTFAAGSASISSQLYFANVSNTRAWNWQLDENNNAALWHFTGAAWARKLSIVHGGDGQVAVPSFIQMDNSYSTTPLWDSLKFYLYKDSTQSYGIGLGSSADVQYWSGASNNGVHRFYTSRTMQFEIGPGGACIATGDLRAPIFYDSNNTGYYLDPNSGGLALRTSGYWIADSTAWAGDINGKIQYHDNSWYISAANQWVFRASSGAEPFRVTQGGIAIASADMRAPIFYDNNNTAFYIDAASNSVLNTLTLGGRATTLAMYYQGFTLDANTMAENSTGFTYSVNAPYTGPIIRISESGYSLQLNAPYGGGTGLAFRTRNGDIGSFNAWQNLAVYGTTLNVGALYATIYYDGNNSAYYLDPAAGFNFLSSGVTFSSSGSGLFVTNAEGMGAVTRLGAAWNRPGSYSNTSYTLGSESSLHFWISGLEKGYIDSASNLVMNGSIQAPIFYDLNNTALYVDPGGTSILSTVRSDRIQFSNANEAVTLNNGSYLMLRDPTGRVAAYLGGADPGNYYDNTTHWFRDRAASNMAILNSSGMYAPTFYDFNDSGYYLNLNSTDNVAMRMRGGMLLGPNPTWGAYLRVGSNGWVGDHSSIAVTNGNLHIDAQPGFALYLAWYNTSTILVGGSLTANGNITAYSDIRVKDNVETIPNALDKLDLIRGVTYTRTDRDDKERRYAGVIAQEIEQVLPEAIFDNEEYKSVDYNATIGLLIQAVKELRDEVEALRK